MSDAKSPQDLSMDEILATIRRIISEDEQSSGAPQSGASAPRDSERASAGDAARLPSEAGGGEEVLELNQALNDDGSVRQVAPAGPASQEPERLRETPSTEIASEALRDRREPEFQPDAGGPRSAPDQPRVANDDRLVAEVTSLAAAAAFSRLASAPRERREPPLVGGRPLDEVVCDLLRPLLQTWLDENLPGLVERLVQAEIARISARPAPS